MRKTHLFFLAIAAALGATGNTTAEPAGCAALSVQVSGFENGQGHLALALFNSKTEFNDRGTAIRRARIPVTGSPLAWRIDGLALGEYGLLAYHDENDNSALDLGVMGVPAEPIGISNNPAGLLGPPRWRAARFSVTECSVRLQINLK